MNKTRYIENEIVKVLKKSGAVAMYLFLCPSIPVGLLTYVNMHQAVEVDPVLSFLALR